MSDSADPSFDASPAGFRRFLNSFRGPWSPRDVLLLVLLCPLLFVSAALTSERVQSVGHVLPQVMLQDVDVSGFSARAVDVLLDRLQKDAHQHVVKVRVGSAVFRISGADLHARIASDTREQLLNAGRTGNVVRQVLWRFGRLREPAVYQLSIDLDPRAVEEHLVALERAALPIPREGSVSYDGKGLRVVYPEPGETIARTSAAPLLLAAVRERKTAVELPIEGWSPKTTRRAVDEAAHRFTRALSGPVEMFVRSPALPDAGDEEADRLRSEEEQDASRVEVVSPAVFGEALATQQHPLDRSQLEVVVVPSILQAMLADVLTRWQRPAEDATFEADHQHSLTIRPSKPQWILPVQEAGDALLQAALSDERRGVWQLAIGEQPRITTQLAHALNIRKLVGKFVTRHPCCRPRVKNIHRIADLLDGTVVLPGETFSVNTALGPRTAEMGFELAPTIVRGEMDDTVGGGISQFATTLFNAVLHAGYEIIERQPHSYYFPRYPMGHEATLSFPKPDLVFRNDTQSGMLIKTRYSSTSIHVFVYGDNEGRIVKTEVSKPFDHVDPETEYLADETLSPTEERLEQRGERGFTVFATRVVSDAAGSEEKKETRKVIYKARPERIFVHPCKLPEDAEGYSAEPCPEQQADAGLLLSEVAE